MGTNEQNASSSKVMVGNRMLTPEAIERIRSTLLDGCEYGHCTLLVLAERPVAVVAKVMITAAHLQSIHPMMHQRILKELIDAADDIVKEAEAEGQMGGTFGHGPGPREQRLKKAIEAHRALHGDT